MKRILKLLIVFIFVPMLISCFTFTSARSIRDGIDSFRGQDYRRAFIRLMPAAEKGQPDAQYAVGYMYYYGQGVVEDRDKAWFWIHSAARLGQPDAIEATKILGHAPPVR